MALLVDDASKGEDLGKMIAKVQDDLRSLRCAAVGGAGEGAGVGGVDPRVLESMLARTEQAMQVLAEKVMESSQNRVSTLPAVAHRAGGKTSTHKGLQQPGKSETRNAHLLRRRGGSQNVSSLSPGKMSQVKHLSHLVSQPSHPLARQLLADHYHLPFSDGGSGSDGSSTQQEEQMEQQTTTIKGEVGVMTGTTVEHLTSLPKANRRDALLTPPAIQQKDARKGLLSLLQRGLIPPAAELVLSPPPVAPRRAHLHSPHTQHTYYRPQIADGPHSTLLASLKLDPHHSTSSPHLPPLHIPHTSAPKMGSPPVSMHVSLFDPSLSSPPPAPPHQRHSLIPAKSKHVSYIIINSGRLAEGTNNFIQFKKDNEKRWSQVELVLDEVVQLCRRYMVRVCILDCAGLAELSMMQELGLRISREHILAITTNRPDVEKTLAIPGRQYKGEDGKVVAANKIRATYLMYKARKVYMDHNQRKWAAAVVSTAWMMFLRLYRIKRKLKETRAAQLEAHRQRASELRRSWQYLQSVRRTVVHIPSLGYLDTVRATIHDLHREQSLQIGRLCDIQDENVDVVYVSPVTLNEDTVKYYHKLLSMGLEEEEEEEEEEGASQRRRKSSNAIGDRLHIVTPENLKALGYRLSLSSVLLYSPRCLARIRRLVAGRPAYIVSGIVCKDDIALADALGLPLLASEPEISALYSTKAGARCLLRDAGLPLLPPYEPDIFSEKKLIDSLSYLVANNLLVPRWIFKLIHQVRGRGFAYCDVIEHLPCYDRVVKEAQRYGSKWSKAWAQEQALKLISSELPKVLDAHAHTVCSSLYPTWTHFLQHFIKEGGLIEGTPPSDSVTSVTVDLLIEPTGNVKVLSTLDQICSDQYEVWGGSAPQCCVCHSQLMDAVHGVAAACKHRGILGHLSLDLLTFIYPHTSKQTLWCVDLDLGYSNTLAMYRVMSHVTGLQLDTDSGALEWFQDGGERRKRGFSVLMPHLFHANLSFLYPSVFFQMCKAHHIGYDNKEKRGTLFCLLDEQHRNYLSMLCVDESLVAAMEQCCTNLTIINQEISIPSMTTTSNFKVIAEELQDIIELMKLNSSQQ